MTHNTFIQQYINYKTHNWVKCNILIFYDIVLLLKDVVIFCLPEQKHTAKIFFKQNYCSTQYSSEEQNEKKNISFDIQIEIVCL